MKYIVFKVNKPIKREIPVIFPDEFVHSDVAAMFMQNRPSMKVVAAGDMSSLTMVCSGKSETLKKKSRGITDMNLITTYDYLHGIV